MGLLEEMLEENVVREMFNDNSGLRQEKALLQQGSEVLGEKGHLLGESLNIFLFLDGRKGEN